MRGEVASLCELCPFWEHQILALIPKGGEDYPVELLRLLPSSHSIMLHVVNALLKDDASP